jgi:hypothetical protein
MTSSRSAGVMPGGLRYAWTCSSGPSCGVGRNFGGPGCAIGMFQRCHRRRVGSNRFGARRACRQTSTNGASGSAAARLCLPPSSRPAEGRNGRARFWCGGCPVHGLALKRRYGRRHGRAAGHPRARVRQRIPTLVRGPAFAQWAGRRWHSETTAEAGPAWHCSSN